MQITIYIYIYSPYIYIYIYIMLAKVLPWHNTGWEPSRSLHLQCWLTLDPLLSAKSHTPLHWKLRVTWVALRPVTVLLSPMPRGSRESLVPHWEGNLSWVIFAFCVCLSVCPSLPCVYGALVVVLSLACARFALNLLSCCLAASCSPPLGAACCGGQVVVSWRRRRLVYLTTHRSLPKSRSWQGAGRFCLYLAGQSMPDMGATAHV